VLCQVPPAKPAKEGGKKKEHNQINRLTQHSPIPPKDLDGLPNAGGVYLALPALSFFCRLPSLRFAWPCQRSLHLGTTRFRRRWYQRPSSRRSPSSPRSFVFPPVLLACVEVGYLCLELRPVAPLRGSCPRRSARRVSCTSFFFPCAHLRRLPWATPRPKAPAASRSPLHPTMIVSPHFASIRRPIAVRLYVGGGPGEISTRITLARHGHRDAGVMTSLLRDPCLLLAQTRCSRGHACCTLTRALPCFANKVRGRANGRSSRPAETELRGSVGADLHDQGTETLNWQAPVFAEESEHPSGSCTGRDAEDLRQ